MPGIQLVSVPRLINYLYDGSLAGFFCCVHESVYAREMPSAIWNENEAQPSFLEEKRIATDSAKARKVRGSIIQKIAPRALELLEHVFLSCLAQKELLMLRFLLEGYAHGRDSTRMLGAPWVAPLLEAERHLLGEVHLLLGFVRFSDYGGALSATIGPKNFVLPLLARHFAVRYPHEPFMIYDKTHKAALFHQNGQSEIVALDHIEFPQADESEAQYRRLWKQFYDTIAIETRTNPLCRRTHMPKRYWAYMTEMQDQR